MSVSAANSKMELRGQIRARLKHVPAAERALASASIGRRLQAQEAWRTAHTVLFFVPRPDEPDLWPCIEAALAAGKLVCLPRTIPSEDAYAAAQVRDLEHDVVPGRFGIREPASHCAEVPLNRLDLVLVPGLAFDRWGRRLGRGKGHYDRWLAGYHGTTCGAGFDEQFLDAVPVEPHDLTVNCILTPSRWIEVSPRRPVLD